MSATAVKPVLETAGLSAGYFGHPVVRNVDLEVRPGEIVALIGANGAGKTTTLRAVAGDLPALAGEVRWEGAATRAPLHARARQGLAFITEERSVFMSLSVDDNIRLGRCDRDEVIGLFPELKDRGAQIAGLLSGGEQQMLTLGRALARRPRLLLADELSLGLAPMAVDRLLAATREAASEHQMGVVLVEQHIHRALRVADRWYLLQRGEVIASGDQAEAWERIKEIEAGYV